MTRIIRVVLVFLAMFAAAQAHMAAQSQAVLSGTVVDSLGARLAGATVTLLREGQKVQESQSGSDGDVFIHGPCARSLSGAGEHAWFSVEGERGRVPRSGRAHRDRGGARDRSAAAGSGGHCRRNRAIAVEDRRARHRDRRGDDRSHQQARRARGASSGSCRADRAGWPAWWRHIALPSRR